MEPDGVEPPAHRRPAARDRLWVHIVWEIVLAAGVVAAVLAVRHEDAGALSGTGLSDLLVLVAAGILLGSAFALSLRAAVPNLAVGGAAVAGGVLTAWLRAEHGYELWLAALITLGAAVALGLAFAVVAVGFRLPGWAVGLGAALGLWAAVQSLSAGRSLLLEGGPNLRDWAWPLAIGAAALSVLGGVLGLLPRARLTLGQYRPSGDPAAARGSRAGLTATAALVGSMVLAAGAGLIIALQVHAVVPDDGLTLLGEAAAAAFLGGTSAYGRRGGVFGTVLAAVFLQLAALWLGLVEAEPWTRPALLGGAILVGLLVGRVVEAAGTVKPPPSPDEAGDDAGPDTELWDPYGTGSFARPGSEQYQTGGFTPASAYRPESEPYWPGQAPAPEAESTTAEPARDLGAYREPGGSLGAYREQGRGTDR
jgi:ribose/xylose/arabinose/galactoside ABC-type transport system permease subunit